MKPKNHLSIPIILLVLLGMTSGCTWEPLRPKNIKIAVPNTIDALPLYVADSQGYFYENRITVEFIPVASEEESDSLLLTGQVDAAITDIISVLTMNQNAQNTVIVRTCLTSTDKFPLYRIVTQQGSEIDDVNELRHQPIGVSAFTSSSFVTDYALQKAGLTINEIYLYGVPIVADRYSLVMSGTLPAAALPEPWASIALKNGAKEILTDQAVSDLSSSVIAFRTDFVTEYPKTVRRFLEGFEEAVNSINDNKLRWNETLTKYDLLPSTMVGFYNIPDFPTASVPDDHMFVNATVWLLDHNYVSSSQYYELTVDSSFLP